MEVKLVSLTGSMIADDQGKALTPEQLIVYIARVSNPSNQLNTATADKLLGYLIQHKHWSPFDMVNMTVSVTTSRAIAHQILRHWSIKPQEFSQRYAEATSYEPVQLRLAAATNRQSSTEEVAVVSYSGSGSDVQMSAGMHIGSPYRELAHQVWRHIRDADNLYKDLIAAGIAKECARMILPLTTSTTLYLNGSIRSWIHYLQQRTDEHAQLEHRQVAFCIEDIFETNFPNLHKAITDAAK